jgi:type I restriction enzyme S subunit
MPIALPSSIAEQRAIAEALSDADARIAALEALIAKKRDLKQAAMQQLLTGKTRLPGFSGHWEVKRLGDHVRFLRNGTLSRAQLAIDAPVKYLHYGDIHGSASLWLHPRSAGMPCVDPELVASLDRLADGDLIFADASEDLDGVGKSIEIADCTETEVVSGLHTIAARFDKAILADGFKAYLQFMPPFRDHLRSMAAGTKVLATNRKHIGSATLALPEPPEQIAIAEVLSDMDADIAALDAEAEKARTIKQGMMQNLLTGKVRLV